MKDYTKVERAFRNRLYQLSNWKMLDYFKTTDPLGNPSKLVSIDEPSISLPIDPGAPSEVIRRLNLIMELVHATNIRDGEHIFVLRYFEQMTYKEIAAVLSEQEIRGAALEKEAARINKICHRIREKLKEELGDDFWKTWK